MKYTTLALSFFLLLFWGCEEITPPIDLELRYTGRRVLVEEFTGVQCVNCPEGSKRLEELVAQHGEYVIPVSIHAGFFSPPYNESLYDFRTPEGTNLEANLLGPVAGYPAATINRRRFNGENELPLTLRKWSGYIVQELLETPKVEVDISTEYDTTSRILNVEVALDFIENITDKVGISVMILETDIADVQLTPQGKQLDYKHKHALRTMLTEYSGDNIADAQAVQGARPTFNYAFRVPNEWNDKKCSVVAFVNKKSGGLDVLQANTAEIR
jgi:hypothetical protein